MVVRVIALSPTQKEGNLFFQIRRHRQTDHPDKKSGHRGTPTEKVQEKRRGDNLQDHQQRESPAQEHQDQAKGQEET